MSSVAEALPLSCQTHVLGDAVIPQRLRSLRKTHARPASPEASDRSAKRPRSSQEQSEPTEAAIAEVLLDLSHSPRSSNSRESDVSTEDEEFLQTTLSKPRSVSKVRGPPACSGRDPRELEVSKSEVCYGSTTPESSDGNYSGVSSNMGSLQESTLEEYPSSSLPVGKSSKSLKKLPGRCKCGKRVSASHPPCKSELMLLCERFCKRCEHLAASGEPTRIHLNECAVALGVPRRRLYDITIVYEAVEVVKRTGKLAYVWRGTAHLPALVEQLKREEEEGLPVVDRKGNSLLAQHNDRQTTHSLWTLSRKFIRLLLTLEGPIQLSDAADYLIGNQPSAKRQQTQVTVERRLYDIGSILATLNLIQRTYIEGKRQPAFSWNWKWEQEQPDLQPEASPAKASNPHSSHSQHPAGSTAMGAVGLPALGFTGHQAPSYQLPPLPLQGAHLHLPHAWSLPASLQAAFASSAIAASSATAGVSGLTGSTPSMAFSTPLAELAPLAPLVLPELSGPLPFHFPGQRQCGTDSVTFPQAVSARAQA